MTHRDKRAVVVRLPEAVAVELKGPVLACCHRALADEGGRFCLNEERDAVRRWRAAAVIYLRNQLTRALDLMGVAVPARM